MPIVDVKVWQGFGEERVRDVIKGITDSFVQVGIPAQAVHIVITEVPRTHWGEGGQQASARTHPKGAQRPSAESARGTSEQKRERPRQRDSRPGRRPRRGGGQR